MIIKNNKNEDKKRPVSGFGLFGRKGMNKNIKFNDIGYDKKKWKIKGFMHWKSDNNIKKKRYINKNIKIIKRDKNINITCYL